MAREHAELQSSAFARFPFLRIYPLCISPGGVYGPKFPYFGIWGVSERDLLHLELTCLILILTCVLPSLLEYGAKFLLFASYGTPASHAASTGTRALERYRGRDAN